MGLLLKSLQLNVNMINFTGFIFFFLNVIFQMVGIGIGEVIFLFFSSVLVLISLMLYCVMTFCCVTLIL
jgi:hypothetical protein